MEVPVINMISDFDVGINSLNDLAFAVSGVGKLHHAYSFWNWSDLLLIAFFATFTTLVTRRIKSLVFRLRNVDVSLPSPTLLSNYDSYSDSFFSSDSSDHDDYEDNNEHDKEDESVSRRRQVDEDFSVKGSRYYLDDDDNCINGNIPWMRRCNGSFEEDLLSWPNLGELGSSGVVKLWDHLDVNGEEYHRSNAVASFSRKFGSSSFSPVVLLAAEKKGSEGVKVSAWDERAGFEMPALLAEWKQSGGRLVGKMIRINAGDVDKIYVGDDVDDDVIVGDMRMLKGVLTEVTESEIVKTVRLERRR